MMVYGERILGESDKDNSVVNVKLPPNLIRTVGGFVSAWIEEFPVWKNPLKSLAVKFNSFSNDAAEESGKVKVDSRFELPVTIEDVGLLWKISAHARSFRGKECEDLRKRLGIFKGDQVFIAVIEISRVFFDAGGIIEEGAVG